jgi:hypothetical protein
MQRCGGEDVGMGDVMVVLAALMEAQHSAVHKHTTRRLLSSRLCLLPLLQ